jgi:glycerol uptake facilitator-like aquaporin
MSGAKAKSGDGSADVNVKECVAEALGTFIFASGAASCGSNWGTSVALFVAMHAVGDVSSELNPALTILRLIQNNGKGNQGAAARVASQVVGAYLAGHAAQFYK